MNKAIHKADWFKDRSRHVFWILAVLVLALILTGGFPDGKRMVQEVSAPLINVIFIVMLLGLNVYWLIPEYLKKGNWLRYGLSVIISLLLFSPLKLFALYLTYRNYPLLQKVLINDQFIYFSADVLLVFLSTSIYLSVTWFNQQRIVRELQKQNIQSEIKFLKAQINPHFLFNTLNNIYSLSLKKDDKAPEAILKLSNILRYILYECNEKEVLIESEWKYILDFIELEKLRMSKDVDIDLQYEMEDPKAKIAPLVIMTFVENAFKHGSRGNTEKLRIVISLNQRNDKGIRLRVSNNFSLTPTHQSKSFGIGLENVRKRLRLLYAQRFQLDIRTENNQYIVDLNIKS